MLDRDDDVYTGDLYNKWNILGIVLFWILGDIITTYIAINLGASEANILVRYVINNFGFTGFFLLKILITLYIITSLYWLDNEVEKRLKKYDVNNIVYGFCMGSPKVTVYLIILAGILLTINNIYIIYLLI